MHNDILKDDVVSVVTPTVAGLLVPRLIIPGVERKRAKIDGASVLLGRGN